MQYLWRFLGQKVSRIRLLCGIFGDDSDTFDCKSEYSVLHVKECHRSRRADIDRKINFECKSSFSAVKIARWKMSAEMGHNFPPIPTMESRESLHYVTCPLHIFVDHEPIPSNIFIESKQFPYSIQIIWTVFEYTPPTHTHTHDLTMVTRRNSNVVNHFPFSFISDDYCIEFVRDSVHRR